MSLQKEPLVRNTKDSAHRLHLPLVLNDVKNDGLRKGIEEGREPVEDRSLLLLGKVQQVDGPEFVADCALAQPVGRNVHGHYCVHYSPFLIGGTPVSRLFPLIDRYNDTSSLGDSSSLTVSACIPTSSGRGTKDILYLGFCGEIRSSPLTWSSRKS